MFGIGTGEVLVILVIAMLVVGPERMVELSQQLGAFVAKFRSQTDSVTQEFREALSLDEIRAAAAGLTGDGEEAAPEDSVASDVAAPVTPVAISSAAAALPAAAPSEARLESAFVEREVRVTASHEKPVVLADSEAIEIEVGELVVRDEDAEPLELEQAMLVIDEETPEKDA